MRLNYRGNPQYPKDLQIDPRDGELKISWTDGRGDHHAAWIKTTNHRTIIWDKKV